MNSLKWILGIFVFLGLTVMLHAQPATGESAWKFKADGKIIGTARIAGENLYFGSDRGTIYALSTSDGALLWSKKTGGRIASRPAYHNGHIFVLSGDGNLHKLNASDGKSEWVFQTEGAEHRFKRFSSSGEEFSDIWDYYLSSPVVEDSVIFFGSSDRHIYAVDARSGKQIWKYKTGDVVHSDPIVDEGIVYAGSFDGFMYALDAADGSLRWKFDTVGAAYFPEGAVQQGAEIHKGVILFGSRDYNLYVLNKKTGKGFWNFKAESWVIGRPLVHGERVYFGTSDSHLVYSKDIRDYRKIYWKTELPLRILGSLVHYNSVIMAGNFDGVLYGLNKETGRITWQFKTDGHKTNYASIFREDGSFQPGFSIYGETIEETAANDEKMMSLGSILATPVVEGSTIYFGSTDSTFYAVRVPE